jgi:arylsulfatase A-like enzyme
LSIDAVINASILANLDMADAPKTPRNLFQRKGGIWTVLGLLLVGGIAFLWWQKYYGDTKPDPEPEAPSAPRHLLLISIDTLRADHLGCYGYEKGTSPNIDALAKDGVLFERHYSCYPLTLPAHLTQFTGVSSLSHRVRDNLYHRLPDELGTLSESFKADGFRTGAFVSAHTMKSGSGLERGFDVYDDVEVLAPAQGKLTIAERKAPRTLQLAGDWIAAQGAERFFCFIHLFDPHAPYERHAGTDAFGSDTTALYDGEIAFTDAELGKFLDRLRKLDVFKDTLIVLTADHGEGLGEHGELTHGYYCYDTTTHVPLIIRGAPGIKAARVPHVVRNYDLAPTLAEIMQLKDGRIKKQAHGVSLRPQMLDPATDPGLAAYVESHYAWLNANWAKIRGLRSKEGLALFSGDETLYLPGDQSKPTEGADSTRAARDEITRLMNAWLPPRKGASQPRESHAGSPYPGEVATAQSFDPESLNDSSGLPSPHEMKAVLRAYQQAELAYDEEKFETCAAQLRDLLKQHPDFVMAQRLLAAVTQGMVKQQWRELGTERCIDLTVEAADALAATADHALRHDQPDAALAADLNRALLLAWLNDHVALAELADRTAEARIRWLAIIARYRATKEVALDESRALMPELQKKLGDDAVKSAQEHLSAMENGQPILLAPWER